MSDAGIARNARIKAAVDTLVALNQGITQAQVRSIQSRFGDLSIEILAQVQHLVIDPAPQDDDERFRLEDGTPIPVTQSFPFDSPQPVVIQEPGD